MNPETYESDKEKKQAETVESLAQKLYEDDGFSGNIYKKASTPLLRVYENRAIEILEKEGQQMNETSPLQKQDLRNIDHNLDTMVLLLEQIRELLASQYRKERLNDR